MYNARTWQITAQFLFRSKTKTIFYKADWKVCNKNIHFIGSCTGQNTVLCSIKTFFLFCLKPSICKSCEETDTWTLKVVGYCIKASSTVTSVVCCQLSLCWMPARSHPASGYSDLLAIEQVTFHQHYCQAGITLVY